MSDLRPVGVSIDIEGVERHLLFTLNAIDEIQEHYDMELQEIMDKITDKGRASDVLRFVFLALLNDEADREAAKGNNDLKKYSEKETGWLITLDNQLEILIKILEAYGASLPNMEDDDPNRTSGQVTK